MNEAINILAKLKKKGAGSEPKHTSTDEEDPG